MTGLEKSSRLRTLLAAAYELAKPRNESDAGEALARAAVDLGAADGAAVVSFLGTSVRPILAEAGVLPGFVASPSWTLPLHDVWGEPLELALPEFVRRLPSVSPESVDPAMRLIVFPLAAHRVRAGLLVVFRRAAADADDMGLLGMLAQHGALALTAASALQQSEIQKRKLEAVLHHIPDGLVLADRDRIVYVTAAAHTLLSPAAPRLGAPLAAFLDEIAARAEGHPALRARLRNAVRTDRQAIVTEVTLSGAPPRDLRLRLFTVPAPSSGTLTGLLVSDVTAPNSAERLRGEFLRSVSHELRTPLASILAYAETMLTLPRGPSAGVEDEFLRTIVEQSKRLDRLISNLLSFSRAEAGAWSLQPRTLDLSEMVPDAVRVVEPQAHVTGIRLYAPPADGRVLVRADRDALQAVLLNLLSNAVKYNRFGGEVRVTTTREAGEIVVVVSDTGIGMTSEESHRIFERFYRAPSVKGHITGAGIGLALVRSLVEMMGGSVAVVSRPGEGSAFTVRLPAEAA